MWLKQTFTEADKNGDGCLSIGEVLQLLHKLNVNLPRQKVKEMFKKMLLVLGNVSLCVFSFRVKHIHLLSRICSHRRVLGSDEADTDDNQGTLAFEEFCTFYKTMSTRRDLYLLMLTYSNHKDHMDTDDLVRFLEIEQKMSSVTKDKCLEIVSKFEPCPENQVLLVLGIDGFTNYMRSPTGDIFNPEHYEVNQDMTQPLCNYFINSSHNTYLSGDQLLSQSRVDMYAYVLQAGCRCVEVDCWDGPDGEPIVHHGYTLTSKIFFKDVIETINKYAFAKNQYPVILSIENHCTVPQQKKMAQYLLEVLQDKLDLSSVNMNECRYLPSPEMLKGKILVKGKKLPANIDENAEEGDVSDEDSGEETEDECKVTSAEGKAEDGTDISNEANPSTNKRLNRSLMGSFKRKRRRVKLKKGSSLKDTNMDQESTSSAPPSCRALQQWSKPHRLSSRLLPSTSPGNPYKGQLLPHVPNRKRKTMRLARALSDLVKYTKSVRVHDIDTQAATYSWQVSSISETKANQIIQLYPTQFFLFNQRQLVRIYPSSYRVDSSNYNPQPFWNSGCHLVALNYQSEGRILQLNRAKFSSNGNCGYILKPKCMCKGVFNPVLEDPLPDQVKTQLVLKIISGQQLPKPKDSMLGDRGEIIDPFVEVEIIGLPVDCCKEQTRVVDDNGFNPMWEETFVFTLHMPQIALVRFLVWDHDPIGRDFIGQRTIAFTSMMPGYRHVYLEGMEEASIFIHVAVNDITGKVKPTGVIKGLFHKNQNQGSLNSNTFVQLKRKSFSEKFLRRTASAPAKGRPKAKKGNRELPIEENCSDRESDGAFEPVSYLANPHPQHSTIGDLNEGTLPGRLVQSEPLKRANRVQIQDPSDRKQSLFNRLSNNGPGRASMASCCIKWAMGSRESPRREQRSQTARPHRPAPTPRERAASEPRQGQPEPRAQPKLAHQPSTRDWTQPKVPLSDCTKRSLDARRSNYATDHWLQSARSCSVPQRRLPSPVPPVPDSGFSLNWQNPSRPVCIGDGRRLAKATTDSISLSDSDSLSMDSSDSLDSIEFLPSHWPNDRRPAVGTLQREMSALFDQKMDEIRSKSPIFFTGKS
ncbi:hypothetical protein AAFF_G00335280 [Aldrovandia affinis]|uniref:Phosphoinositide phospholipase C n=1 Tax=Aldrovandia affinis TaxID=143900 RepID=A0AAD7SLL7_9TELE|nr:hypothetical protein AAFF_G00335280 [Aldrovandia affinis]